jgi:hypothetical protein
MEHVLDLGTIVSKQLSRECEYYSGLVAEAKP